MSDAADWEQLELAAAAVVHGDRNAWPRFWARLEPQLLLMLRGRRFLGPLADRDDECRDIVVDVMAQLRERRFTRLRSFFDDTRKEKSLRAWLRVLIRNAAIDYL